MPATLHIVPALHHVVLERFDIVQGVRDVVPATHPIVPATYPHPKTNCCIPKTFFDNPKTFRKEVKLKTKRGNEIERKSKMKWHALLLISDDKLGMRKPTKNAVPSVAILASKEFC
ncbi:MAG: hypothetical protein P8O93_03885 [Flavobacteriaceae bacterium]|nr:hypothetical protein [Flavobacteriaceae bacterium]